MSITPFIFRVFSIEKSFKGWYKDHRVWVEPYLCIAGGQLKQEVLKMGAWL